MVNMSFKLIFEGRQVRGGIKIRFIPQIRTDNTKSPSTHSR